MASTDKRRNLRSWRNKRDTAKVRDTAAFKRGEEVLCWLCKNPIDMELPAGHRFGWTLDHVEAIAIGGHILGQTLAAHRSCNSAKGKGTTVDPLAGQSRKWL